MVNWGFLVSHIPYYGKLHIETIIESSSILHKCFQCEYDVLLVIICIQIRYQVHLTNLLQIENVATNCSKYSKMISKMQLQISKMRLAT